MEGSDRPFTIVQLSDLHCGEQFFLPNLLERAIAETNELQPDVVVVSGDLTANGFKDEYSVAKDFLAQIDCGAKIVIPGNHDSRNVGYVHFRRLFGDRTRTYREAFEPVRAERLLATGFSVAAVDSSQPDVNDGHVGRDRYTWIRDQFAESDDIKIFVIHHHLVPIPGTGRERNIITDAGDLLAVLTELDIDVVLAGHKHVPYFWGLNGILVCNSGTASTKRVRGLTPPSWNEVTVDASTVKVYVHYPDGRRELSVIFSRKTRALIREAFSLTDDFHASNRIIAH